MLPPFFTCIACLIAHNAVSAYKLTTISAYLLPDYLLYFSVFPYTHRKLSPTESIDTPSVLSIYEISLTKFRPKEKPHMRLYLNVFLKWILQLKKLKNLRHNLTWKEIRMFVLLVVQLVLLSLLFLL